MSVRILAGHWVDVLRALPDRSVHCVVTSPPYWGLRSYLPDGHPLKAFELGSEPTLVEYIDKMVEGFEEVRRVLRDDGTLWLNLGDTYATRAGTNLPGATARARNTRRVSSQCAGTKMPLGLKPKDLCGVPWRVAFALQEAGWYLRCDVVWEKPTAMPEAVTDRPTKSHEYVFLLSKSERYFYDAYAIREPVTGGAHHRGYGPTGKSTANADGVKNNASFASATLGAVDFRNKRSVWRIKAGHYDGAHFATFPPELVRPCILAGTSERGCCSACGAPWERQTERENMVVARSARRDAIHAAVPGGKHRTALNGTMLSPPRSITIGWAPSCMCTGGDPVPCVVLDPFGGTGTTAEEAERLGRHSTLIELSPESIALAEERTAQRGLFAAGGG